MTGLIIEAASQPDLDEILEIQKAAYRYEAEIYDDFSIPPLLQAREGITAEFGERTFLKAVLDGQIVGSVRAHQNEGTCFIGRLVVRPGSQNRGIGTGLMKEIESRFESAGRFELFTGHASERNLHLYDKLGYRPFRHEEVHDRLTLVYMEKVTA